MGRDAQRAGTPAPAQASAPSNILVVDVLGEVFERLRQMGLPAALWRVLDARRLTPELTPQLIVIAAYAPISDWAVVEQLCAHAPTLLITTTYQRAEAAQALRRGPFGYLDAGIPQASFDRAVRGALLQGEPAFSRELIGAWMREERRSAGADARHADGLTGRQRQILALIAQGATDKSIAATLGIAAATAQKHVTNILRRLEVPNRAAAVATMRPGVAERSAGTASPSLHLLTSGREERLAS